MESAAALIAPHLPPTPCRSWHALSEATGCEVWLKHENETSVGAFKVRGGFVYLDELLRRQPKVPGLVAASTGNHGQSIAWNARRRGVRAVIVVPHGNNPTKNAAMQALGAELVEHGTEFQHALEHSRVLAMEQGLHPVPSFHPWLVRGVATYALEMYRAVPPLDAVYVPIGLGSGFCGVAAAREALGLRTKIIGVVSSHAPAYALSFERKSLVTQPSGTRVAEGVACSTPDPLALAWVLQYAHEIATVTDDEAIAATRELMHATQGKVEGAGALAYAALKQRQDQQRGQRVACILSGGNASEWLLSQVAQEAP